MTNAQRAEILRNASTMIQVVVADLDTSESHCETCGTRRYHHYGEHWLAEQLAAMTEKLKRLAGDVDRGLNKERGLNKRDKRERGK